MRRENVGGLFHLGGFPRLALAHAHVEIALSLTRGIRFDQAVAPFSAARTGPFDQRHGAVIKGANGHPITEKVYREGFRRIARAAGIPDDVWSMDARAGGATEAHEREVPIELISESLTHSNTETTVRYIRRRAAKLDRLAEEVSRKRAAESGN